MTQPSGHPDAILCDGCGKATRRPWSHLHGKYCPTCKASIIAQIEAKKNK